ncbi:pentapeptide repeat-containing protein [Streptomyces sp. NPDC088747]|uniref:pentapeptide repeat-containing protein n=1 Tax=Streptomyces sp. NPDC088747 TaxID=3365886 RepID=UPI0038229D45
MQNIVNSVKDPTTGEPHFRNVDFRETVFLGVAQFAEALFEGEVAFDRCHFHVAADFSGATFKKDASFSRCTFDGQVNLWHAVFHDSARLDITIFKKAENVGPLTCNGTFDLSLAEFHAPMTIQAVAREVLCREARWEYPATIRLRYARLDLTDAIFMNSAVVISRKYPFFSMTEAGASLPLDEAPIMAIGRSEKSALSSLQRVDCAMLTLADMDLSECSFIEAVHLDQLRLDDSWVLHRTPRHRIWSPLPFRWTSRQVIKEECEWRATDGRTAQLRQGWGPPVHFSSHTPRASTLTITYRQLRKSREDAKDEPGAADFYYGEMEMRRQCLKWNETERWLLQAYWILSGYGLRAARAVGWFALSMVFTIILMMGFGLPQESPRQAVTGTVPPDGGRVSFEIDKEDPKNPSGDRFTSMRFEKALSVTLNSAVFRSSGQDLTTAGGYIEMASRFSEPILLGLAALAIRGRVKR